MLAESGASVEACHGRGVQWTVADGSQWSLPMSTWSLTTVEWSCWFIHSSHQHGRKTGMLPHLPHFVSWWWMPWGERLHSVF